MEEIELRIRAAVLSCQGSRAAVKGGGEVQGQCASTVCTAQSPHAVNIVVTAQHLFDVGLRVVLGAAISIAQAEAFKHTLAHRCAPFLRHAAFKQLMDTFRHSAASIRDLKKCCRHRRWCGGGHDMPAADTGQQEG